VKFSIAFRTLVRFHSPDTALGSVFPCSRYFNQEQYETGYKAKSHLLGERESVSDSWREFSPQRLRDSPRPIRASASIDPASEPESPADKAMRLRWHDRTTGRAALRDDHKNGQKSAWVVRKYGLRLMPELYGFLNPMPFEAAAQMEKDLAEDLRADGYTVTGGT
jgi:hypothetical protein